MSNESNIVKEGYLIKSPPQDKLMAQWHKRFFVLWSSRLMEYYTTHEKKPTEYRKTIDLQYCEDMVAPLPIPSKGFVIKLTVKVGQKMRDYLFECVSESDMNEWVKCLARVCGFTPVDEEEESNTGETSPNTFAQAPLKKPMLRPPIPPPKPASSNPAEDSQSMYEEIFTEGAYHSIDSTTTDSEDDDFEIGPEQLYEDLNVNQADMNRCPPPVWRPNSPNNPPPLPDFNNRAPRKWSKSLERHSEFELISPSEAPSGPTAPILPPRNITGNEHRVKRRQLPAVPSSRPKSEAVESPVREPSRGFYKPPPPNQKKKAKPLPPAKMKPSKFGSSDNIINPNYGAGPLPKGIGVGINVSNDPKFSHKLQKQRQQIYGDSKSKRAGFNQRSQRSQSWHEDQAEDLQQAYEAIDFPNSPSPPPVPPCKPRVRIGSDENDEGYIDCDPSDDCQPQDYLDSITANKLVSNDVPLPLPKPAKQQTELFRPPIPIPPREQIKPPRMKKPIRDKGMKKSESTGGLLNGNHSSPSSRNPPPLPSREVVHSHSSPSSPTPALPPRDNQITTLIQGSSEGEESPPPIPLRHAYASDRLRATSPSPSSLPRTPSPDNPLPLPPRSNVASGSQLRAEKSPPPLPSRTPRQQPPNRSISEPYKAHGQPVLPAPRSLPLSPKSEDEFEGVIPEEYEEIKDEPIFESVSFGRRTPSPLSNGLPPRNNLPPPPAKTKHRHQQTNDSPSPPKRVRSPPPPANKPTRDKPRPPPVANRPQPTKKPPTAPKPKPGGGTPKPVVSSHGGARTTAAARGHQTQRQPGGGGVAMHKPALKPKPLPPPKPVAVTGT